jgi:integrase/recombinase XerD
MQIVKMRVGSVGFWDGGGCVQPYLEGFVSKLTGSGFTGLTARDYARSAIHLGRWLDGRGVPLSRLTDETVEEFGSHSCTCPGARPHHRQRTKRYIVRVRCFVAYLRRLGVAPPENQVVIVTLAPPLVGFREWMTHHRGVKQKTIDHHERLIKRMLPALGDDPSAYDATLVRRVLLCEVRTLSQGYAKTFANALRAFLRFLVAEGRCNSYLDRAVPTIASWRLSSLPRFIESQEVERVIDSCDASKPHGTRDRAVLLLLARLGLRAGDIVAMSLDDFDWSAGTVRVCGKGRRAVCLPLPQDVGDAVLEYLLGARPAAITDRVFLCAQAPVRPFKSSSAVSDIVRFALQRAGIKDPPSRGAHLLRHSAATSMLRSGATLEAVSTVLRHVSSDMTAHYAKIDTGLLALVAQPWPEGAPC